MDATDAELLRRYTREGSEPAFRELVERHLNMVYGVAWRHLRSHTLAADVAQIVFVDLARSARSLSPVQPLAAWLHVVARRTAVDVVRAERRRLAREQTAAELAALSADMSEWTRIEPLLDEALETLDEGDRQALLLRFFENRSLREVGAVLGTSDDAAQKRVSRALEQLRASFAQRGVTTVAASLAAQLPAAGSVTAPAGLASSIAAAALPAAVSTATAVTAVSKTLMATSLVLAVGLVWEVNSLAAGREHFNQLQREEASIAPALSLARTARDRATVALQAARQRAEASRARTVSRAATESALETWLARVDQLKACIAVTPALAIPEMRYLQAADWLVVTRDNPLQTEMQRRRALADLRRIAKYKPEIDRNFAQALRAAARANAGKWPAGAFDFRSYLNPRLEDDIIARYEFTTADEGLTFGNAAAGGRVFQERAAVDADFDMQMTYWESNSTSNRPFSGPHDLADLQGKAYRDFRAAHPNEMPLQPDQLLPYLPADVDAAKFREFWAAQRIPYAQ